MKRLIFVNGAMGVGKSAVCARLKTLLAPCAYVDGDWCWDITPFSVTEEKKELVLTNAAHLLRSFLGCSGVRSVLFGWVMPRRAIVDELLARIGCAAQFSLFTLTAREETLRARLASDIAAGRRDEGVLERSLAYLPLYEADMGGVKIATDGMGVSEVAQTIADMVRTSEAL